MNEGEANKLPSALSGSPVNRSLYLGERAQLDMLGQHVFPELVDLRICLWEVFPCVAGASSLRLPVPSHWLLFISGHHRLKGSGRATSSMGAPTPSSVYGTSGGVCLQGMGVPGRY